MKVTVFGASGKVGRLVVDKLLDDGHQVTVLVHNSSPFNESEQLKIIKGDIHHEPTVNNAIQGSGAVISTLGSWGTPQKDILSAAMRFAIPAMQQQDITRLITLTGSAAQAPGESLTVAGKVMHRLFGLVAQDILRDGEEHLRLLSQSGLDWTTLRAGIMKNGPAANYVLNDKLPGAFETVSRETVAQALVDQLQDNRYIQQAPHLHG